MGLSASNIAALQGAGAATSMVGSFYGAKSQQSSLDYQAAMAETNARMAEKSAQQEMYRGQREVAGLTLKAGHLKSAQRAGLAAAGIDLGEGNALEILTSTDLMKEIDSNTASANAVRAAWGARTQGTNYQNDATTKRASADSISPMASAATSLLGSAGSIAASYYTMSKAGAFDTGNGVSIGYRPDSMRGGK